MKKYLVAIAGLIIFTACQEEKKIGFVDNVKLVNEYQEKIDLEESLKSKVTNYEKFRDSLGQAFQKDAMEAEKKSVGMTDAEMQKLRIEFQQKEQMLTQQLQMEQGKIGQESRTLNDTLRKKVIRFVENYGKENGYTYILGKNEAGSVMFGSEENDITEDILEKLNADYKKEQ